MMKLRLSLPAVLAMAGAVLFTVGAVVPCPRVSPPGGGGGVSAAVPAADFARPAAGGEEKDPALVVKAEGGGERW